MGGVQAERKTVGKRGKRGVVNNVLLWSITIIMSFGLSVAGVRVVIIYLHKESYI